MKVKRWGVSANWGLYNHWIRNDLETYQDALAAAYAFKVKHARVRAKRQGRAKGRKPAVYIWKVHTSI